jgi:hypothetical protein
MDPLNGLYGAAVGLGSFITGMVSKNRQQSHKEEEDGLKRKRKLESTLAGFLERDRQFREMLSSPTGIPDSRREKYDDHCVLRAELEIELKSEFGKEVSGQFRKHQAGPTEDSQRELCLMVDRHTEVTPKGSRRNHLRRFPVVPIALLIVALVSFLTFAALAVSGVIHLDQQKHHVTATYHRPNHRHIPKYQPVAALPMPTKPTVTPKYFRTPPAPSPAETHSQSPESVTPFPCAACMKAKRPAHPDLLQGTGQALNGVLQVPARIIPLVGQVVGQLVGDLSRQIPAGEGTPPDTTR